VTDHLTSFFPLASTLANRSLRLLGVLLIGVAAAALATGLASATAPSTVTGAGACLLAFGLATLLTARQHPADLQPSTPRPKRHECGVLPNPFP
jgi:protein-S-isoprenylcysteine O-methyltransferase Ste14